MTTKYLISFNISAELHPGYRLQLRGSGFGEVWEAGARALSLKFLPTRTRAAQHGTAAPFSCGTAASEPDQH